MSMVIECHTQVILYKKKVHMGRVEVVLELINVHGAWLRSLESILYRVAVTQEKLLNYSL